MRTSSAVVDRALDQPVLVREAGGLGAVRHAELAIDVREVELDRLLSHPQLLADRLVREAAREGSEDRGLSLGEAGSARRAPDRVVQPDLDVNRSPQPPTQRVRKLDRIDPLYDEGA